MYSFHLYAMLLSSETFEGFQHVFFHVCLHLRHKLIMLTLLCQARSVSILFILISILVFIVTSYIRSEAKSWFLRDFDPLLFLSLPSQKINQIYVI